MESPVPSEHITAVRAFNRFYTRQIGILDEGLLDSGFSLTEARVLYELAHRDGPSAADLVRDLGLDPGYVSRMLKGFERRGLLVRAPSATDARQSVLALTDSGRAAFAPLERASEAQVAAMLAPLDSAGRAALVAAMDQVRDLLGSRPAAATYDLRPLQVGDIGWIARRHGMLYAEEYGWDGTFEAFVAELCAAFVRQHDPRHERAWIAERAGGIVGSVFIVRHSDSVAKLRMLYVEPAARGLGIGRHLVDEGIGFARTSGYRTLILWTNDILTAARHIYESAGFRLIAQERHHSFGKDLVGQTWELTL